MLHIFEKVSSRMATISVALDAGARSEGGKFSAGLAHMMEHMCFKGTENRNWQEINRQVAYIGGHSNAYTSHEMVVYYIYVPVENIEKAMEILADQVFNSAIPEEEFLKEKEVVKQEEISDADNPTHELDLEFINRVMAGRLKIPIIGTKESIDGFTHKELTKYYKMFYKKSNAVIGLGANMSKRDAKSMLTKHFGKASGFKLSAPVYDSPAWESDNVRIHKEGLEHAYAYVCVPGINMFDERDNAFEIAAHILGGGMNSRLFEEVREKRGLAYSIGAYAVSQRETGNLIIQFQTEHAKVDEVLSVINEEIEKIATKKIDDEELIRAKNTIRSTVYSMQDSTMGIVSDKMRRAMFGSNTLEKDMYNFDKISSDDVLKTISDILSDNRKLIMVCEDQEKQ